MSVPFKFQELQAQAGPVHPGWVVHVLLETNPPSYPPLEPVEEARKISAYRYKLPDAAAVVPHRPPFMSSTLAGVYVPGQGQQQQQPAQHFHQQPQTPRYIPGGGGGRSSFSSPPPPPPSPFSPPSTPHADGRGAASGSQFAPPAASWETSQPPLPHGSNRRQVSFQGSRGVTLSFNYWVGRALSNQV